MRKLTDKEIIDKAKELKPNYKIIKVFRKKRDVVSEKIRIDIWITAKCDKGHNEYDVLWDNFKKASCPECKRYIVSNKNRVYSSEQIENQCEVKNLEWLNKKEFITETKRKHNNIIQLKCKICGHKTKRNITNLFSERKCLNCSGFTNRGQNKFEDVFYNKYSKLEYLVIGKYINCKEKIRILHLSCGNIFSETPDALLTRNRFSKCKICHPLSRGESSIVSILNRQHIVYDNQYWFSDCINPKTNTKLRFDFAIFEDKEKINLKCLIEYQGEGHFKPIDWAGKGKEWAEENFKEYQYRDVLKQKYCKEKNIKLIKIPYWDFDNIEYILHKELII